MSKLSLEDLLSKIDHWKIQAGSAHNDGWTRQHYQEMLDKVRSSLNRVQDDLEQEESLDNYD